MSNSDCIWNMTILILILAVTFFSAIQCPTPRKLHTLQICRQKTWMTSNMSINYKLAVLLTVAFLKISLLNWPQLPEIFMSDIRIRVNFVYTQPIGLFLIKEWVFGNTTASLHPVTTPVLACVAMQLQEKRDGKCTISLLPDTDMRSSYILQRLHTGY